MKRVLAAVAAAALAAASPVFAHDEKPKPKAKPEAAKDGQKTKVDSKDKGDGHDKKH